jgi:hypothetical protein
MLNFVESEPLSLKQTIEIGEKTIQKLIVDNPSILGLGDFYPHDERVQFRGGRLDILLKSIEDSNVRIAAEIQLGTLDRDHLLRAWEYYLNEKSKFPQYEISCLVVSEDVDERLTPVIQDLFANKPISILLMKGWRVENKWGINFIKFFDGIPLGTEEEDDQDYVKVDRNYWVDKRPKGLPLVDEFLKLIQQVAPEMSLNYNKHYIGLTNTNRSNNFVSFKPNVKGDVIMSIKLPNTQENQTLIENTTFTTLGYDNRWKLHRVRITKDKVTENENNLIDIFKVAYQFSLK